MQVMRIESNYDPISVYIHFPWCIKKCPYCDFNSHANNKNFPEELYVEKILLDFDLSLDFLQKASNKKNKRKLISIFFGGGTPSLLSGKAVYKILNHINQQFIFNKDLEVTLEVNPGTTEQDNISNYFKAGVTRISLGAQSFQDDKLKYLGRIHTASEIVSTIDKVIKNNFNSFNIDLMYGLPNQTEKDALYDLNTALTFNPPHISWYQLTIEPNTAFYKKPPILPEDETTWQIMQQGVNLLQQNNHINYEVSAFAKPNYYCVHNLNYWQYGDYLGLGPGAHSKITINTDKVTNKKSNNEESFKILRLEKPYNPKNYFAALDDNCNYSLIGKERSLNKEEIIFEFMLNNLRLADGFLIENFIHRTSLSLDNIKDALNKAKEKGLLKITKERIKPTVKGKIFLNNLQELFC